MASFGTATAPSVPPTSSASSPSPSHISLALDALSFFKLSSHKEFCRIGGAIDPFTSIHSIHLFVRWLASLPVNQILPSELLLVAWAVKGLPAGLRSFLTHSLGLEKLPEERINLEYLKWQLEMWRSVFSSTKVVEYASRKGKGQGTHIVEWYAAAPAEDRRVALDEAEGYWDRFSGKKDEPMPSPPETWSAAIMCPGGTQSLKRSRGPTRWN